jgi:hypothetical protein
MMKPISFKRHRFLPDTIRLAVWLYFRFTTSLRDEPPPWRNGMPRPPLRDEIGDFGFRSAHVS